MKVRTATLALAPPAVVGVSCGIGRDDAFLRCERRRATPG
jgi:hypothetical protein